MLLICWSAWAQPAPDAAAPPPASAATDEPAMHLAQRRARLDADDVAGRLDLAAYARDADLPLIATELYREVLAIDADHEQAYDAWTKLADLHPLPEDEQRLSELAERFDEMTAQTTEHFIVLSDGEDRWARARAMLLERTHDYYYRNLRRAGFRPRPLTERLVCVLYADHADYVAYAKRVDNVDMGWSGGYFSTRTNRIVFYDDRTGPAFQELRDRVSQLEQQVEQLRRDIDRAGRQRQYALAQQLRRQREHALKQQRFYRNRSEALAKLGNAAKAAHEATHQLAYNSGLQRPDRVYPFWFSEGLATSFETDEPARPFGPFRENTYRLQAVMQLLADDKLIPLKTLVSARRPPAEPREAIEAMYNQAWALFAYLFRERRDDLRAYLRHIASLDPGERSAEQLHDEFVEAFGPVDQVEAAFRKHIKRQ